MPYYPGYNPYSAPLGQSFAYPNTYAQPVSYAPVQYAAPVAQSFVQPVAVQPVVQQSYIPQPVAVQQVVAQPAQQTIRGESRVEYKEYQRQVVEMETETVQVQVPKTKYVTDYYPIEYQTEYIPRTVYEQQTEYVPITKTVPRVEYETVERQVQRVNQLFILVTTSCGLATSCLIVCTTANLICTIANLIRTITYCLICCSKPNCSTCCPTTNIIFINQTGTKYCPIRLSSQCGFISSKLQKFQTILSYYAIIQKINNLTQFQMQAALAEAIKEEQFMLCFKESKEQAHFQLCMDLFERSKAISQRAFVRYVRSRKQ